MALNIHGLGIRQVRELANSVGIVTDGLDRDQIITALLAKEREVDGLRLECVRRGLSSDGLEMDLRLRLAASDPDTITKADQKLYSLTGRAFLVLGLAALVVSIPHLACELSRVTGLHWAYAVALALVIDGAICTAKLADVLTRKFDLGSVKPLCRWLMVAALGFSAGVNAVGFAHGRGVAGWIVGGLFAALIAGTTYASFCAAAYLLTVQSKRDKAKEQAEAEAISPVEALNEAANNLSSLLASAKSLKLKK